MKQVRQARQIERQPFKSDLTLIKVRLFRQGRQVEQVRLAIQIGFKSFNPKKNNTSWTK